MVRNPTYEELKQRVRELEQESAEHKRVAEALREREERYRAIYDNSLDGIMLGVPDGRILGANRRACEILGYTEEEICNLGRNSLVDTSDQALPEKLEERSRTGRFRGEVTFIRKDGARILCNISSSIFKAKDGQELSTVIFRDITEHKRAEEGLRESEARFHFIAENTVDMISQHDPDGRILYVSSSAARLLGYSVQELIGSTLEIATPPDALETAWGAIHEALEKGADHYRVQHRMIRKDGSLIWVETNGRLLYDEAHSLEGVICQVRDITEQRHAQETLRSREIQNRTILQSAMDGFWLVDMEGRLIEVNDAYCKMSGYSEQELVTMSVADLEASESPEEIAVHIKAMTPSGDRFESKHRRRDGSIFDVEASVQYQPELGGRLFAFARDITERRLAEEVIRESLTFFHAVFNAVETGILLIDPSSHTIVKANPKAARLCGTTPDLMEGQICHQFVCPAPKGKCPVTDLGQTVDSSERILPAGDGKEVPILKTVVPITIGSHPYLLESFIDISQRRRAEEALKGREEEAKRIAEVNRTMAEIGRVINSSLDIDAVYERFAEEVQKLIPFDRISINLVNLKDNTISIVYVAGLQTPAHPKGAVLPLRGTFIEYVLSIRKALLVQTEEIEDNAKRFPSMPSSFQAGIRSLIAVPLSSKDGVVGILYIQSTKPNSYSEKDLRLAERVGYHISSAVANSKIYAEQKLAEEALRKSEARFRDLAELLPQVVYEADLKGILTYGNRYASEVFGYLKEDLERGLTVIQSLVPEDRERAASNIRSVLTGDRSNFSGEYRALRYDGTSFPVMIYSAPIIQEGTTVGTRGILIDITDRKRAEEERKELQSRLAQAQKMEAIGTLAGGIAHDFNNILGGIIGYAELAMMKEAPDSDNQQYRYLRRVVDAGLRAKELVQQILKFSRGGDAAFAAIALGPIIKESVKLLQSTLPKNIEIRQHIEADQGKVMGNPTQIHQVIMNVCTNAYHAMREHGGVLTVTLEKSRIESPREFMSLKVAPGDYIRLSVSDTGHGMSPQTLERIFEPYFTTKKTSEGTGLGLSVTLGIVKSHNGLIEVESKVDKGSRFDVYLPVTEAKSPAGTLPDGPSPMGNGERVLVVDDEHFFLNVLQENLETLGYRVTASHSSLKALEIFGTSNEGFDLVITDQSMTEMTGVQLIAEIRKYDSGVPVILCTGYSETVSEQSAKYYGITRFLMKPVTAGDLARAVHETLAGC